MLTRTLKRYSSSIPQEIKRRSNDYSNLTPKIINLTERKLWREKDHPLRTMYLK